MDSIRTMKTQTKTIPDSLEPVDDQLETGTHNVEGEAQLIQDDPENQEFPEQGEEEDAPLLANISTSIN